MKLLKQQQKKMEKLCECSHSGDGARSMSDLFSVFKQVVFPTQVEDIPGMERKHRI